MTDTTSIKDIRQITGLSQKAFCEKYGIPRRTLEDWERGRNAPAPYLVDLLRRAVESEKSDIT